MQVASYKIKDAIPKHDKFSLVLRVSNNIHQIPCLETADFTEEWVEEEKIPVKKDTPAPAKPATDGKNPDQPAAGDQ